jgi:predicted  nucleic acid-binding Zn-ribbon protein
MMTQQRRTALKELQKLDIRIQDGRQRIRDFDPMFEEVEAPALILEGDLEKSRKRLQEMKLEERRLELSTEEKRDRLKRLDERSASVRNLREEAAVSAELEMVKRGLQNDEQEAFTLLDQVGRVSERVAELESAFAEASQLVEPRRDELLAEREQAKKDLEILEGEREICVGAIDPAEIRIYDAIRGGEGQRAAVSELTEDGACGNCFGVVPLQHQNEIRHGETLIRCEACGVILAAPEPVEEAADEGAEEDSAGASEDSSSDLDGDEEAPEADDPTEALEAKEEA